MGGNLLHLPSTQHCAEFKLLNDFWNTVRNAKDCKSWVANAQLLSRLPVCDSCVSGVKSLQQLLPCVRFDVMVGDEIDDVALKETAMTVVGERIENTILNKK